MFAVFRTGGKQFRAEPGTTLLIPTLDAEPGTTVTFNDVLLASGGDGEELSVGALPMRGRVRRSPPRWSPTTGRRRSLSSSGSAARDYRRKQGHRQGFTVLRVTDISIQGESDGS